MVTPVTAIVVAIALAVWGRCTRRHPAWALSPRGRFYVNIGYPMALIATYFCVESLDGIPWAWAPGLAWALAALTTFALGFAALNDVLRRHREVSVSLETIPASTAAVGHRH